MKNNYKNTSNLAEKSRKSDLKNSEEKAEDTVM